MPDYLPHTDAEVREMLDYIGIASLEDLYASVPSLIARLDPTLLKPGRPEPDVLKAMHQRARLNAARTDQLACFAGAGAYDHEVPPVVRALAGRSEFVTSYTPYQAEVAQGVLQLLFEFQTMVSRLSGLPIANASLYDGASALVEAVHLGVGVTDRSTVWCSSGVHPNWRGVLRTASRGPGYAITEVPLRNGVTDWSEATGEPGVVVVANPNFQGYLEEVQQARAICDRRGALLVLAIDPVSAAVLKSGGEVGADVVIGEGQPFGGGLSFGGPYLGLFACQERYVRQLPGRLVGETVDLETRRAYVTTLRTREQDIRRERATSNVCTNQTLLAVTAAIQMSWLGTNGLRDVAVRCGSGARFLAQGLARLPAVHVGQASTPYLREFTFETPMSGRQLIAKMAAAGYLAGVALSTLCEPGDGACNERLREHGVVVTVTERRTREEIDGYVDAIEGVLR